MGTRDNPKNAVIKSSLLWRFSEIGKMSLISHSFHPQVEVLQNQVNKTATKVCAVNNSILFSF